MFSELRIRLVSRIVRLSELEKGKALECSASVT
jgi:hypothetical protein